MNPLSRRKIMTLSEQFRAEGIAKGKIERELEIVKNLRATGAELTFIAKVTALPLIKVQEYCNEPAE
jgi:predicted transposase YdaD